jgi:hypothetical protein
VNAPRASGSRVMRAGVAGASAKSTRRVATMPVASAGWAAAASVTAPTPKPTLPRWLRFGAHSGKIEASAAHEPRHHAAPQAIQPRAARARARAAGRVANTTAAASSIAAHAAAASTSADPRARLRLNVARRLLRIAHVRRATSGVESRAGSCSSRWGSSSPAWPRTQA